MKQSEVQEAIKAEIQLNGFSLPIKYDDDTLFKHNNNAFAQVFIRSDGTITDWCESRIGIIGIRIHMRKNKGIVRATKEAEKFSSVFSKNYKFGGVWITDHAEELTYNTQDSNWDILTTATPYEAAL